MFSVEQFCMHSRQLLPRGVWGPSTHGTAFRNTQKVLHDEDPTYHRSGFLLFGFDLWGVCPVYLVTFVSRPEQKSDFHVIIVLL